MSDIFLKVKPTSVIRNSVQPNLNNNNDNNIINNKDQTSNEPILIIQESPRASILKINSFVPNLKLQRFRKNSTKDLSLFSSSTYIKRFHSSTRDVVDKGTNKYFYRNTGSSPFGICTNKTFDKTGRNIYEYPGHYKSLSSTAKIKSSLNKCDKRLNVNDGSIFNSSNIKSTINLPLEYSLITNFGGVCKILRTQKEKEKLPDRINCDKRGLTSIPLFLNENNIRLLSLQHNLINVFHVPSENFCKNGKNNTEFPQNNKNKPDVNIIDLPIVSNDSKNNINFDKFDLKIDATTNNLLKKKNNTIIINGDCKKDFLENSTNNIDFPTNATVSTLILKNSRKQPTKNSSVNEEIYGSNSINYKTICSNKVRNTLVKNSKIKNLVLANQTKQISTSKGTVKYSKKSVEKNNKSFDEIENISKQQNINFKFREDDSMCNPHIKNMFVDKVFINSSYADIYQNLIFLDLYNNQIEKILNLDGFKCLTVLLLGKNRITDISGIASLQKTLRVLDLHGNRITNISNKISNLHELKSLNLAGNLIEHIYQKDFSGLINLKELNLKRNKIKQVQGFDNLFSLERLWLCHNDLQKVEDMLTIAKAINLQEITVENNPVSMVGECVSFLVSYLPNLKILSQMPVTDQVRKAAMIWRKNKEISERNNSTYLPTNLCNNNRREEIISNARTNWELLRSQRTSDLDQKLKTEVKKITVNNTIEHYIENGMKQFHTPNSSCYNDCKVKPLFNVQTKNLINTNHFQNICAGELDSYDELQLPLISNSQFSRITNSEMKSEINNCSSNSSLGPNLHSSSSGLGSDSEDNSKLIGTQANDRDILRSVSACSSSTSSLDLMSHKKQSTKSTSNTVLEKSNINNNNQEEYLCDVNFNYNETNISDIVFQNNIDNKDYANSEKEILTPKSASTFTSRVVNCSTKGDYTSSSNSILSAVNYVSKNVVATNCNDQEKQQTKSLGNTAALNNISTLKKYNKNSHSKYQTINRINKNCSLNYPTGINNLVSEQNFNLEKSTNSNNNTITNKQIGEREREQGGDYLIEICGKYLNIYGIGALRFIDKQWNQTKASDVNTLNFSYINFNNIAYLLNRIKQRFPNAQKYIFRETNLQYLGQLNALADLQGIQSLEIDSEGNQIINNSLWRNYAMYRLSHWGLKNINNIDIHQSDIDIAHKEFMILPDIVLWIVPESILHPIIHKLHFHEKYTMSTLYPKEWLLKTDKTIKEIIGKEVLHCKRYTLQIMQSEERCFREKAKIHFGIMIDNLCHAAEKLQIFDIIWPKIFLDIIANTLLDYSQMEIYLKKF